MKMIGGQKRRYKIARQGFSLECAKGLFLREKNYHI